MLLPNIPRMSVISATASSALYGERLAIILGYLTLLSAIAILASCRLIPAIFLRFHKDPMQSRFYQTFTKGHYYYWWIFGLTLLLHVPSAFFHTGIPVAGDPDAGIHWVILALALISVLSFILVLFSCRFIITFWEYFAGKNPIKNRFVKWIYSQHSIWWWFFAVSFLSHVAVAYAHAGIWPS